MNKDSTAAWLSSLRALLIDLDGVIYRGDVALPGAADLLPALSDLGIAHAFARQFLIL